MFFLLVLIIVGISLYKHQLGFFCPGGLCRGGFISGGFMSQGVFVQGVYVGGFMSRGFMSRGFMTGHPFSTHNLLLIFTFANI